MSAGVGADVEALCSKCGDVWHVVVAKVGDQIAKVQCKECGAYHRYRSHEKVSAKSRSTAAPRVRAQRAPVERFEKPSVAADLSRAVRPYSAVERYVVGDRIDHTVFGQGVVEASPEPGKVTVFFAVGRKVLVQARDVAANALTRPKPFDHSSAAGGKRVGES
jgi:DNA replicative helicase MCM subunit Mcm2 (Cdc46/Mcm family)